MRNNEHSINSEKILSTAIGLAVFGTVLIANLAVFSRLVKVSLPATEELLRYIFVWIIMLCTAFVYNDNGLISITMFEELIAKRGQKLAVRMLRTFVNACVLFFAGFCVFYSARIALFQFSSGKLTPVMEIPMVIVTLGMTVGSILWVIIAAIKAVKLFKAE